MYNMFQSYSVYPVFTEKRMRHALITLPAIVTDGKIHDTWGPIFYTKLSI